MENLIDWLALCVALLAFILSFLQFIRDASRQKKESTLNAYSKLQKDVFDKLNKLEFPVHAERGDIKWKACTNYLAKIENFSIGINTGVYSLYILNKLGGEFFIHEYEKLSLIIQTKRIEKKIKGNHYDEFEETVKRLIEYRKCKTCIGRFYLMLKGRICK